VQKEIMPGMVVPVKGGETDGKGVKMDLLQLYQGERRGVGRTQPNKVQI